MKARRIISLILTLCVVISVLTLSVLSATAGDSSGQSGVNTPAEYQDLDDSWENPINYSELNPGDIVIYPDGGHPGIYDGQDESGNDIIIHDSNEIDRPRISKMGYSNSGMMVSRTKKSSATPDEVTTDDNASVHPTPEKPTKVSKEKVSADSNRKSPKTGYTSEAAMLIILMFFAIIGIGVSVYNISKKRG